MKTVIIIGAGRSGTKFLRSVLDASGHVSAIPYDVNYIWREGNESCPDDELSSDSLTPTLKKRIAKKLERQANIDGISDDQILLEKTVSNSLRIGFVNAIFPDAIFLNLIRDGRQVVESAYRCWQAPPDIAYIVKKLRTFPLTDWRYGAKYGFGLMKRLIPGKDTVSTWGPRYRGIQKDIDDLDLIQVVARQWKFCIRAARKDLEDIPYSKKVEVRYEDLISDPSVVRRLSDFLGIADVDNVMRAYSTSVRKPEINGWEVNLSSMQRELVLHEIAEELRFLGYRV